MTIIDKMVAYHQIAFFSFQDLQDDCTMGAVFGRKTHRGEGGFGEGGGCQQQGQTQSNRIDVGSE